MQRYTATIQRVQLQQGHCLRRLMGFYSFQWAFKQSERPKCAMLPAQKELNWDEDTGTGPWKLDRLQTDWLTRSTSYVSTCVERKSIFLTTWSAFFFSPLSTLRLMRIHIPLKFPSNLKVTETGRNRSERQKWVDNDRPFNNKHFCEIVISNTDQKWFNKHWATRKPLPWAA